MEAQGREELLLIQERLGLEGKDGSPLPSLMRMREFVPSERPMEKLVSRGRPALSDEELLAILIGSGTKKQNALSLAGSVLRQDQVRTWLLSASVEELTAFEGIGRTKACRIIAGLELGKRLGSFQAFREISLSSVASVYAYLKKVYAGLLQEHFIVLFVDAKNRPFRKEVVSMGTLNQTLVHPREVFRAAVRAGANALLLAHNHPSGDPEPSPEDISVTRRLAEAGEILGIPILDHLVVGDGRFVSFRERGLF